MAGLQAELKTATKEVAELKSQLAVAKSQVGRPSRTARSTEWALLWLATAWSTRDSVSPACCVSRSPMRGIPCTWTAARVFQRFLTHILSTPSPHFSTQALVAQAVASPSKGCKVLVAELQDVDAKAMQEAAVQLQTSLGAGSAVLLGTKTADGKANFVASFGADVSFREGLGGGKGYAR